MVVTLKNAASQVKTAKIGFSWTTLFFGFFVPLFRGDVKWLIVMLLTSIFTFCLANFILAFIYNKFYITGLLEKGYLPADAGSEQILRAKGFIA